MDEALAYDPSPLSVAVEGVRSAGDPYRTTVLIPQAFTDLLMKLFAFRDRMDDPTKQPAQHHALDLYRVVAMRTEPEHAVTERLADENLEQPAVKEARQVVLKFFAALDTMGTLRLRDPLYHPTMRTEAFLRFSAEWLPPVAA